MEEEEELNWDLLHLDELEQEGQPVLVDLLLLLYLSHLHLVEHQ